MFNFRGHSRSAVDLAYFIMLFIGALMTFHPSACTELRPTLIGIVSVCLSSVHWGVRPRPLRVSRHMPVRAWVGGPGLLEWWVHLTPKPAFSQAKFVPKWPTAPFRLANDLVRPSQSCSGLYPLFLANTANGTGKPQWIHSHLLEVEVTCLMNI